MRKSIAFLCLFPLFLFGQQWTILETYTIPGKASGLAFDGTNLYSGIYGSDGENVYQINPNDGTYSLQFSDPDLGDSFGMTYGDGSVWITDHHTGISDPAIAYEYSLSGNVLSQFDLPDHYMSGIAYDAGNFWVATYYLSGGSETIYKVDSTGTVLTSFGAPDAQPWDLCLENDNMWVADYNANMLYKIDPSDGTILENHPCENIKPAGVVYDGQYLWYVDGALSSPSTLYKVDLGGTGTPAIELSFDQYNFGNVVVGESGNVNLVITNTGNGDLTLTGFNFSFGLFSSPFTVPQTIPPSGSVSATISFTPIDIGYIFGSLSIQSNDPIHPEMEIELEGYGLSPDPDLVLEYISTDFNNVRIGAHTSTEIVLSNQGDANLIVTAETNHFAFYLDEGNSFPLTLSTRDTVSLRYWFSPPAPGDYESMLTIQSNDPDEPGLVVPVPGNGIQFDQSIGTEFWHFTSNSENEKIIAAKQFADLTGDGVNEILVADNEYNVHCINGNSSGSADILWTFSSELGDYWTGSIYQERGLKITNDLNSDGVSDVVVGTAWGSRSIFALDGTDGSILWYFDTHTIGDGGWVYEVDGKYDFNADGVPDILACAGDDGGGTGPKRVWLFDGTNGNIIWDHPFGVAMVSVMGIQDATGDGIPEVVCGESANTGTAQIHLLNGANGNIIYSWDSGSSAVYALMTIPDGNGDGFEDFCYGDYQGDMVAHSTAGATLWSTTLGSGILTHFDTHIMNNSNYILPSVIGNYTFPLVDTEDGTFDWSISPGGYTLDATSIASINGDEIKDILVGVYDNSSGNHRVLAVSGSDGQIEYDHFAGSPVEQVLAIDDLDGNGSSEIVYGLRNGELVCMSGGTEGTQPNMAPVITNVVHDPQEPTTDDPVHVSATITDDVAVVSATCYWGLGDVTTMFPIPMVPSGAQNRFTTLTPIPEDSLGWGIQYYVEAFDGLDTTTSPIYTYASTDTGTVVVNPEVSQLPQTFNLYQNYPNPFNPKAQIRYDLPKESFVSLIVYDLLGRTVAVLVNDTQTAGYRSIQWNGTDTIGNQVSAGIYLYRIKADGFTETKKMFLLK